MHDLAARGAPLEYWFFRTEVGDLRLLVDLIVRRADATVETRVACTIGDDATVSHDVQAMSTPLPEGVANASASIGPRRTTGDSGSVSWDLSIDLGQHRIQPVPGALASLRALDMLLVSRPAATFAGTVTAGERTWAVEGAPGMVAHYWGRALAPEWCWVSVVGEPGQPRLEAAVLRSTLWGARPWIVGGYAWFWSGQEADEPEMFAMPSNGSRLRRRREQHSVVVDAARGRRRETFSASADAGTFVPFGDSIRNSQRAVVRWRGSELPGSLEFRDLERRQPSR